MRSYGALASDGTVVEFAVDTDLKPRERKRACTQLLEGLERHARAKGCASIDFVAAASDRLIDSTVREAGFVAERGAYFSLGVLNPALLIDRILTHPAHRLPAEWTLRFRLDYQTLAELIFRTLTFEQALATQQLVIEPSAALSDAEIFFRRLSLNAPWYTPPVDAF